MDSAAQERLFQEYQELKYRSKKLKQFVLGTEFDLLSLEDRLDLKEQMVIMGQYLEVLTRRVARHLPVEF